LGIENILTRYFKNVFGLIVINFAIKPIWVFVLDAQFQNIYGHEVYGNYFSVLSQIYIYSVILDLGIHNYITKYISKQKLNLKRDFADLNSIKWSLAFIYFLIVLVSIVFQVQNESLRWIFFLVALNQFLFSYFQFLRTFVQGLQLFSIDKWLSSLDRILLVIFGFSILILNQITGQKNFFLFLGIHFLSYLSCIFITIFLINKQEVVSFFGKLKHKKIYFILKSTLPYTLIALLMMIYNRLDSVMLKYLLNDGNYHASIYAYSYRIVDSGYNGLYLFSVFLFPLISNYISENKIKWMHKVLGFSFIFSITAAIFAMLIGYLFSDIIFLKIYKTTDNYAISTFQYILPALIGSSLMYIFGTYLLAKGKYKDILIIVSIASILSVGLNFILIPKLGAVGAALVCSFTQIFVGVLKMIRSLILIKDERKDTNYN
jgi:O-antigen/teichoic acid export membrane protein